MPNSSFRPSGSTPIAPFVPDSANILTGTRTTNGAIITIPQNRIWQGWVDCSGTLVAGNAAAAAATAATVSTTGVTAVPAAGFVLQVRVATPLQGAANTDAIASSSRIFLTVAAGSDAGGATLTLGVGAGMTASATAAGTLIA